MFQMTEPGIQMRCTCDGCPVQFEGTIDGHDAYWRARYDSFALSIATTPGTAAIAVAIGEVPGWYDAYPYGEPGGYDAGYMSLTTAARLLREGVAAFRVTQTKTA